MPIYEYCCDQCGLEFETLVLRSTEEVTCPQCGNGKVNKMLSVCGFKSGGDKGAASSRLGSGASSCSGCSASSCSGCH